MPTNELRKDPIIDRWVIIAKNRGKRPDEYRLLTRKPRPKKGTCFFCPGNEHTTPPEIDRIGDEKNWRVRCFSNKYPATEKKGTKNLKGLYTQIPAYGSHEIIVESPKHSAILAELSLKRYMEVFEMINRREKTLLSNKKTKYVTVFKNEGPEAGASLAHTHMQLISLPQVPKTIADETKAAASKKTCPYCTLAKKESKSRRVVYENNDAIAFTEYAGCNPFDTWVMPKNHVKNLSQMSETQKESLADALKTTLTALNKGLKNPPYNFYLHTSPVHGNLHFHIEISPKTRILAGFEIGYGVCINVMPPEDAARFLRSSI